jgi:hypothetical protein
VTPVVPPDPFEPIPKAAWEKLRRRYPHPARIMVALEVARDLETCRALLAGEPVAASRLDPVGFDRASRRRLVRLDFRAIDLLDLPAVGHG